MATYKKRGYKQKPIEEVVDQEIEVAAEEMESTTAEVFNTLDETANKTEEWVAANQKYIFMTVGALALVALLYVGYQRLVVEPKEQEAANEVFQAHQYFADAQEATSTQKDSIYGLALNGDGVKPGLLQIIEDYGSTSAGKNAKYMAGFAFLKTGKYKEAIENLDGFKTKDPILQSLTYGGLGDAFSQLKKFDEALGFYDKAAKEEANSFTTPKFLLKAAKIAVELGKSSDAVKYLEQLKEAYPSSKQNTEAESLLAIAKAAL